MERNTELERAIRDEREAEQKLAACRRRVNELIGLAPEKEQRKKKASRPGELARACGL